MSDIFNPCPLGCDGSGWIRIQDTSSTGDMTPRRNRRSCALHHHPGNFVPYRDFCRIVDFMKNKLESLEKTK